jgi:hypothetical protein
MLTYKFIYGGKNEILALCFVNMELHKYIKTHHLLGIFTRLFQTRQRCKMSLPSLLSTCRRCSCVCVRAFPSIPI